MIEIRKAKKSDLEKVEFVCKATAGKKALEDKSFGEAIAKMYSTYYINEEADNCFLLVDEMEVVGYVICSANVKSFRKAYWSKYFKLIFKENKALGLFSLLLPFPYMFFKNKYPSHLHIDLLDDYQGKGYGTKLINALLEDLSKKCVRGIMLMVDSGNTRAIGFYKKLGFKKVIKIFNGVIMAREI